MEEESSTEIPSNGKKIVKFKDTPIMSTYLVAFIVGDFDYVEGRTKQGILVRVYTPVGKREQGTFALDVAAKTLSYFADYFGIAYPLKKCDMIAISEFAAGKKKDSMKKIFCSFFSTEKF